MISRNARNGPVAIRSTSASDVGPCLRLHNTYYKEERTEADWKWLYCDHVQAIRDRLHVIAESDGAVVGTQAGMRLDFVHNGEVFPSIKPEDALVLPRFWGRGVFAQMFEKLEPQFRRMGVFVLWGFTPAPASFVKIGFQRPTKTKQIVRIFSARAVDQLSPAGSRRSGFRHAAERLGARILRSEASIAGAMARASLPGLELRLVDRIPEEVDRLSLDFSKRWNAITVHRSREFLDWRLLRNPFVRANVICAYLGKKLIGYAAFALPDSYVATLVDVIVCSEALSESETGVVVSALLDDVERRVVRMGASAIRGWSVTDHPFDRLVRRTAKRRGWLDVARGYDVCVRMLEPYVARYGSLNIHSWYITRIFTLGALG